MSNKTKSCVHSSNRHRVCQRRGYSAGTSSGLTTQQVQAYITARKTLALALPVAQRDITPRW